MGETVAIPDPIVVDCRSTPLAELMSKEWIVTNKLGSYASSTVVGSNTRRYHGLLVASTLPPVGRQVVLSVLLEQVLLGDRVVDLSTFQFAGAVSPAGYIHLARFENGPVPTWYYEFEGNTLIRQLVLAEHSNTLAVRYRLEGSGSLRMRIWPFLALRDFHALRRVHEPHQVSFSLAGDGVRVEDRQWGAEPAWISCDGGPFQERPQWWYRFQYPVDIRRGQEGFEDLYTPGSFQLEVTGDRWTQLTAACQRTTPLDFDATIESRTQRRQANLQTLGAQSDDATRRLAMTADDFIVKRHGSSGPSATILAGYHWFSDWGRDSFIALNGVTMLTGRLDQARQVLDTFAHAVSEGMIPNRFDDYGGPAHYNSVDASMWFIKAVDQYLRISGDEDSWSQEFHGPVKAILEGYHNGTRFGIHADADGLIQSGSGETQLTWMDVKFNDQAITPRQGKPVEVNALWLEALHIMADRCDGFDQASADHYAAEAQRVAESFRRTFWYEEGGYLYDCIAPDAPDASLRPNQIIAVAQPHCPLTMDQQRSVVNVVKEHLLTPFGLRTLSPFDGRYRGMYGGSWESRDRAYHQGTVWAWLMGYFIQAHLKVNEFSDEARQQAGEWLRPLEGHILQAGLDTISEIFDGNAPHEPRGCISQAWSVAEVLRAKLMVQRGCPL